MFAFSFTVQFNMHYSTLDYATRTIEQGWYSMDHRRTVNGSRAHAHAHAQFTFKRWSAVESNWKICFSNSWIKISRWKKKRKTIFGNVISFYTSGRQLVDKRRGKSTTWKFCIQKDWTLQKKGFSLNNGQPEYGGKPRLFIHYYYYYNCSLLLLVYRFKNRIFTRIWSYLLKNETLHILRLNGHCRNHSTAKGKQTVKWRI